jgi:hypothetical protein
MDSEEAAKDMQGGKIPYLMFPRGTIHSGGSPIIDIWKKRFQKPGQEHILGVIEGNTSGEEIYIDMISVRNKWQRNHIAKMMLEFLKSKFPNAKLKTSGQTERGKKFFKSTDATEVREGMETSPGFKQWFKDSKVVNKDGTPMRVYHGTMFDFASFKEGTKNKSWFSNKTDTASTYAMYKGFDDEKVNGGARIIPLYASIQNPFIIRNDEDRKKWVNTSEDTLKSLGYDGVLFINGDEVSGYVTSSNQLKSALTNTGEYSQDPDITKEGYGAGIPEQDRLHIPGERWRIKSKDAPKTPKMVNEDIDVTLDNAVDEILGDLSKGMLTESMDVHIKGCENQFARKLNTLDGLANHLLNKSAFPFLQNLPPDQKAYYEKNRVPPYEMITPDGDYWGGEQTGTGVINFYTAGLMTQTIRKILLELNRECKRLGVSLGKMKQEPSGVYKSQVIRIPVVKNDVKPLHRPPELNMANRNAFHIFKNVLQFEPDDENGSSFSFSTQDVIERIQALKHDKGWVGQNQIQPTDSKYEPKEPVLPGDEWKHQDDEPEKEPEFDNPHDAIMHQFGKQMGDAGGGVHMMSGGLDSDSINSRIDKILEIALWAKENGYPEMYVA